MAGSVQKRGVRGVARAGHRQQRSMRQLSWTEYVEAMWGVPFAAPVCPWVAPARPPARAPGRNATPYQVLTACRINVLLSRRRRRDPSFFSVCLHLDSSQDRWRFVPADLMVPADFLDLPCFFAAALACASSPPAPWCRCCLPSSRPPSVPSSPSCPRPPPLLSTQPPPLDGHPGSASRFEFKSHVEPLGRASCVGLLPCSSWRPRRGQCHRCSLSCGCRESVRPAPLSTTSPLPLAFSSARSALSFLTTWSSTPRPAAALTPVVVTPPFVASAGCLAGSWPLARPCECVASRPQA